MNRGNSASILSCTRAARNAEPLEQPLDVRVGALEGLEAQAGRDLRILLRELGAHLPQVLELAVVVLEQARIHRRRSLPAIRS